MVCKGNKRQTILVFIYAVCQVHKDLGEKIHLCRTAEEAFSLGGVVDVKVVKFAGGLHPMLDPELIASEQIRIDELRFYARSSKRRKAGPFTRAA